MTSKKTGVESLTNNDETEDDGWGEPIEPDFFKFTKIGAEITGKLLAKTRQKMRNGEVGKYTVEVTTENGEIVETDFLGGTDLDSKLDRIPVGTILKIRFAELVGTGSGMKMKRFEVRTK